VAPITKPTTISNCLRLVERDADLVFDQQTMFEELLRVSIEMLRIMELKVMVVEGLVA